MRILITGSSGMIGSALCERLLADGHDVIGLDRVPPRWCEAMRDRTIVADLRDVTQVSSLLPTKIDLCLHLAAWAGVMDLVKEPLLGLENVMTTAHALELCRTQAIPRFLFTSSREVYGSADTIPVPEFPVAYERLENLYGASKASGEAFVWAYANNYGLDATIVRFSNVYGRYDTSSRVIPRFFREIHAGLPLHLFAPEKLMDFVHVDDVVQGVLRAIEKPMEARGKVFNLGAGVGTTLRDLAEAVQVAAGKRVEVLEEPNRPGEVMRFVADIQRAKDVLGYAPKVALADGLSEAFAWYQRYDTPA